MVENENKIVGFILNPETGEVGTPIHEGDRIVPKRQIEESCQKIQFGKGRRYIKVFNDTIDAMGLSLAERGFITYLLKFISYTDNVLRYDNKILDVKTIAILLDREYESTRQLTKKLIDKGILAIIKVSSPTFVKSQSNHMLKAYIFNPYIATKSVTLDKTVYDIFTNAGWSDDVIGKAIDKDVELKSFAKGRI